MWFGLLALWGLGGCGAPPPAEELVCDDGIDEDEDGLTDCEDPGCDLAVASDGACNNAADLALYADLDANRVWNACVPGAPTGQGCLLDEACNTTCVAGETGVSEPCAGCFAGLVSCLVTECASACATQPPLPACGACVADHCEPAYQSCFGALTCPFEYGCRDTVDNDGDGLVDGQDPDCQ